MGVVDDAGGGGGGGERNVTLRLPVLTIRSRLHDETWSGSSLSYH
jgi:hypothetical protein